MAEVWLRTNRRAILWAMLTPVALLALGCALVLGMLPLGAWARYFGGAVMALSLAGSAALAFQLRQPRLAYAEGHLHVYLRRGVPIRVPLHVVECFLLGQAPSNLPRGGQLKTSTVLIRLCPREEAWVRGEVDPRLGLWRDSHFILRGTWCEPLDVDVVRRLNAQLGRAVREGRIAESQCAEVSQCTEGSR